MILSDEICTLFTASFIHSSSALASHVDDARARIRRRSIASHRSTPRFSSVSTRASVSCVSSEFSFWLQSLWITLSVDEERFD